MIFLIYILYYNLKKKDLMYIYEVFYQNLKNLFFKNINLFYLYIIYKKKVFQNY